MVDIEILAVDVVFREGLKRQHPNVVVVEKNEAPYGNSGSESSGHILMGSRLPKAKVPCSRVLLLPFKGSISQN